MVSLTSLDTCSAITLWKDLFTYYRYSNEQGFFQLFTALEFVDFIYENRKSVQGFTNLDS